MRRLALAWWTICAVAFMALIVGCGGSHHSAPKAPQVHRAPAGYVVAAQPTLPTGMQAPHCGAGVNHVIGQCLPKPNHQRTLALPVPQGTIRCIDLSNNDPVFGVGAWQIIKAHGFQCAIFKVNESTGFDDSTAQRMTHDARAAGLFVGGYDFLHVCRVDPGSEANTYIRDAEADGLGNADFPPTADSEYPNGVSCNARAWIAGWMFTIISHFHRTPMTYTGEWWWGPNVGDGWWFGGSTSWISGYTGSIGNVPRIAAHPNIDLWQYTDAQWNGVSSGDASVWSDQAGDFAKLVQAGPTQAQFASWRRARDSSLDGYHKRHCTMPVLGRDDCRILAGRVNFFQVLVDQQGQGPSCFGAGRKVHAPVCQIVRPAVAVWTRADVSSIRFHNYRVARYFEGRINHTLATSRL